MVAGPDLTKVLENCDHHSLMLLVGLALAAPTHKVPSTTHDDNGDGDASAGAGAGVGGDPGGVGGVSRRGKESS